MEMETFGVLFGRLVRVKRGIENLSQDQLAGESGLTKSRISMIETGKVANPHTRIVDALCIALSISREERMACYSAPATNLPPRLLEKLAGNFGDELPNAGEAELELFLIAKAEEFREMRERLKTLAETEGRISELINAADAALGEGDFETGDSLLKEAEAVQLQSSTIIALKRQAQLRVERGNAALVAGDIGTATDHFERSSRYFSGVDIELEAVNRYECSMLLRYYGYRYRGHEALYMARDALEQNLGIWNKDNHAEKWCETKIALGGVSTRLAQFDNPKNKKSHLTQAMAHLEEVLELCSEEFLPMSFAMANVNLANIYSSRRLAGSKKEYERNLQSALSLELTALRFVSKSADPRGWGVVQHNLGCAYIALSRQRTDEAKSVADLENAIRHAELSFEVRNSEDSLQYWVASCRTLGEALVEMSMLSITENADDWVRRASDVLNAAASKISSGEHPHQWAEIQDQLARCD